MAVALGLASAFVLTLVKNRRGRAIAMRAASCCDTLSATPHLCAAHDKTVGHVRATRHPESSRGRHPGCSFQYDSLRSARGRMDRGRRGESSKSNQAKQRGQHARRRGRLKVLVYLSWSNAGWSGGDSWHQHGAEFTSALKVFMSGTVRLQI